MMTIFLGGNTTATSVFAASVIVTAAAIIAAYYIKKGRIGGTAVYYMSGMVMLVLFLMILMRQYLREAYLEPFFQLEQLTVRPQWGAFALFAVLFLFVLIPTTAWLIRTVMKANRPAA
ncbi:hypothetical protein ACFL4Q_04055 [candidate division KSB1 bacterium]